VLQDVTSHGVVATVNNRETMKNIKILETFVKTFLVNFTINIKCISAAPIAKVSPKPLQDNPEPLGSVSLVRRLAGPMAILFRALTAGKPGKKGSRKCFKKS
jgi:hypothetical protein